MATSRVPYPRAEISSPARQSLWRRLVASQVRQCQRFDSLVPPEFRVDGNRDFLEHLVPRYLFPKLLVYDVGGGKNPVVGVRRKQELALTTVGLDIDPSELAGARPGYYDRTICADIVTYRGRGDADLVICQSLLEHVRDTDAAIAAIASILRPGGRALIFVPSRNAVYARLNMLLPEAVKRVVLYNVFPEMQRDHGFRAYYDRCTPAGFGRLAGRHGLAAESWRFYFTSSYFRFCLPLHVAWRLWVLFFRWLVKSEAAETFAVVLRKDS